MTVNTPHDNAEQPETAREGYTQAVALLHECRTEHGFLATPTEQANYRRVWGRDSAIMGVASLLTGDAELIEGCRQSLRTLAHHQGPHGEIPSNVDPETRRVSYGGTAGRVDSNLWFAVACGAYWRHTNDRGFLQEMIGPLERVRFLLGAWEFNTRGLLYVPPTGDWADEYLQSGYVLYDQLLYLQAQREFCAMHRALHGTAHHDLVDRVARLKHLIRANYWFPASGETPDDVYHEVLFEKGRKAHPRRGGEYWMPFFSPLGYGYRFDALANALTMVLGVGGAAESDAVDGYISRAIMQEEVMLLPAFHPVITPKDEEWDDLQITFSHTFKNAPHEYHNGGLWPMVTGFYAAGLARRGKLSAAARYRDGIHQANSVAVDGQAWRFPEFLHGQKHTPGGTMRMGWSAAAGVIAEQACQGNHVFGGRSADEC